METHSVVPIPLPMAVEFSPRLAGTHPALRAPLPRRGFLARCFVVGVCRERLVPLLGRGGRRPGWVLPKVGKSLLRNAQGNPPRLRHPSQEGNGERDEGNFEYQMSNKDPQKERSPPWEGCPKGGVGFPIFQHSNIPIFLSSYLASETSLVTGGPSGISISWRNSIGSPYWSIGSA